MSEQTVISIAKLSAVNDRILLLRSQLKAAFCEHALRLEMSVYTTLTSLLKEFVKSWAETQEEIISEKGINNICSDRTNKLDESSYCTHTLSRLENTSSLLLEARLIVTNYLQDILAALLYLIPANELVQVLHNKRTDSINDDNNNSTSARTDFANDNTPQFDIRCYPVPPLMSANQSAFYVSNAQRRHCAEVFFYLCYSSLLPRHHVIAALYPLLDTFSTSTIRSSSSKAAATQALSKEHDGHQINDCNAKNEDRIRDARSTGFMPQTSTLENSVAPNMLSDKRFVHTKQFVKYVLTGLLLSRGSGVRTLCRVFILDDRIEHGAIVEASQQVIRLLTNFNESYVWLATNNISSNNSNDNDSGVSNAQDDTKCYIVQMKRVTLETFMKCICKELVNLFTECAPNNNNSSVKSTILSERTPSFLQNMHNSTLPAETLEERLHIFLALLANEMVYLPRRDAAQVKSCANYPYSYRRFYYFNKYFLTPSFAILSLRISCSAKSQGASSSNKVNKEDIDDSGNTENSNDVSESIFLSLRRLYCLLHATECGVAAKALLLVLESIMPGLLMLSALINHKPRFVHTSIKIELFKHIWAKLLSTEFDAYAEQIAEIMVNACFTCPLRYIFIADDCIHQHVKLCAIPRRQSGNTQHHTIYNLEKTEKDCKGKVNIFDENESNVVISSGNNNGDDDCVVLCLQALRQVVFAAIGFKNEKTYSDECKWVGTENSYTENTNVEDKTLQIASALMENKTSVFCQNNSNNTTENQVDATTTDNNNNYNMLAVSHVLQSAVLCKLATTCTAYSVCNASHDYDINNNANMNDNKNFADSNVLILQHQIESAVQLVELVCVEGEVNSIFGYTPSFALTLHILSIIYPLSTICMQWALSLIPKLLQMTTQEPNNNNSSDDQNSNNILAWELKETMEDKNEVKITSTASATAIPSQVNFSTGASSSIPVKRASLLRELHILHETIERNTEETLSIDCKETNIYAQRILALEAIERAITHLELLHQTRRKTEMRLSKGQQEDVCNTNGESASNDAVKEKNNTKNVRKKDKEEVAWPEELVAESFVIEEWKPMVDALVWALDTHSSSTIAVSLMELAHSLDTITLCNSVSEYVTPHVQSYVCAELWPVLIRALFVCNDICVVTNTIRCLCWLAMYRFDSPTSTHVAHTLFTCLQSSSSSSSSSSLSSCVTNSNKQSEVEVTPLMRFLQSEVHLSRAEIGNKTHVTRFKLRLLELILSLCDYDGDHRTLCNVDDAITHLSQHQLSLYKMLAALCNAQEEAILQIAVLHLIGHVVVALYPRVSLRLVCQLCYDVFHHCPVVMARASCAAMLHTIVLSLQEANLLSALQDDVDLSEVKVLAEAMSCYCLNSNITKSVHTTGAKIEKNITHYDNSIKNMYNSLQAMQLKSPQTPSQIMHNENDESDNAQRQEHYDVIRNHGKAILHLLQNLLGHVLEVEEGECYSNSTADKAFIVTKQKTNILTSLSVTSQLPQLVLSNSIRKNAKLYQ